ncbi:MAG TPA: lipoate--protein ligase family protein [Pirellulaceae bacterium]|nr:lipoate--protein ligase family protein [Pirellulaceae bacterium]
MHFLEVTLPTAAENVALDEALLDAGEEGRGGEHLRIWELAQPAVIVGRSSRLAEEVRLDECRRRGIEIVRRASGGAAIVAGPGCLLYSLILCYGERPHLRHLDQAHGYVLGRLAAAIGRHVPGVAYRGTSDLAVGEKKFSGNSLRCKRDWFLYHGTLLYAAELDLIESLLATAPRQPAYRGGRSHAQFVTNLPLARDALVEAVREAFAAGPVAEVWPQQDVQRLVREKYGREEWTTLR